MLIPTRFSEAYEVVRTMDLVSDSDLFRVEVVKGLHGETHPFEARYYRKENGRWTTFHAPWVSTDDPELAAQQALQFLVKEINESRVPEYPEEP